jgi:hypothetical protein
LWKGLEIEGDGVLGAVSRRDRGIVVDDLLATRRLTAKLRPLILFELSFQCI